jgi:hypothetical protein
MEVVGEARSGKNLFPNSMNELALSQPKNSIAVNVAVNSTVNN